MRLAMRMGRDVMKQDGAITRTRWSRAPTLADRVPAEDDVAAPGQAGRDLLVGGVRLAERRVAAGEEDRGHRPLRLVGEVEERGDEEAGQALEHDLLDAVPLHGDRPRGAGVQGLLLPRQA